MDDKWGCGEKTSGPFRGGAGRHSVRVSSRKRNMHELLDFTSYSLQIAAWSNDRSCLYSVVPLFDTQTYFILLSMVAACSFTINYTIGWWALMFSVV